MKAVKKIEISVLHKRITPIVYAMQGDTGREIECTVIDWEIPEGVSARVWVVKPSKKVVYNDCRIVDKAVFVPLTNQTLAEFGSAICMIEFVSGEDVVSSFSFNLYVYKSVSGDGIPSENESTVLEGMFEELAQDAIKTLEAAKAEAAAAKKSAQNAEKIKNDFTLTAQQAVADVNNAGQSQTQRVNEAGDTQVSRVQSEGTTQVKNVQETAAEIAADREQIHTNRDNVEEITHDILSVAGLEVDYETGICTRLAGATGMNAGRDFGRFKPFGGRRRCTVADDGTITSWYGDEDFVEDGSMGQVMVYQPKFFYKVIPLKIDPQTDGIGYHLRKARYYVSAHKHPGFKCHPAFYDADGNETDYILYSAYEGAIYDTSTQTYLRADEQVADFAVDKLSSIAGAKPASGKTQNLTRPNVENLAQNRGAGWHSDLINVESANQILMIIELGIMDTQTGVGNGVVSIPDNPNTENNSVLTGGTSSLGNTTGMADGTNGQVPISYRGVENPWGNIWKFVYGVNIYGNGSMKGGVPYICSDFNFAESKNDENYESAGFTLSNADGCISAMGYSEAYDYLFFPSECLGNVSVPVGDYLWRITNLNGYCIAHFGGIWNSGSIAGGFNWALGNGAGCHSRDICGRLVYIPTGTPKNELNPKDISKFALTDQATGAMATCMDSADWPLLGIEMKGKCEQITTTGSQLFDFESWKTILGARDTVKWGYNSLTLTATADDTYTPYLPPNALSIPVSPNTAYTLSWEHSGAEGLVYVFPNGESPAPTINEINTKKKLTFVTPEGTTFITFRVGVVKAGGVATYSNIMLNTGETSLPWEPYTGGAPSPSPAYPQEVQETGTYNPETGMYEAVWKQCGVNLFDGIFEAGGLDANTGENISNGVLSARTKNFIPVVDCKEYTMMNGIANTVNKHRFYDSQKKYIGTSLSAGSFISTSQNELRLVGIPPKNAMYFRFELNFSSSQTASDIINGKYPFAFYAGNEAIPYTPYQSDTLHLTADQPWRGTGDVHDEVCERDGVLGTWRRFAEDILDGSEDEKWEMTDCSDSAHKRFCSGLIRPKTKPAALNAGVEPLLCNAYKAISANDTYSKSQGISVEVTGKIPIYDNTFSPTADLSGFKAHLAEYPITVVYQLKEPYFEPFSEDIQRVYRKLKSYAGTTHAWVDDPLQPEVSFKYVKDSKLVLGKLEDRLAALELGQAQTTAAFTYLPPEIQAAMIENETRDLLSTIQEEKE